MLLDSPRQRNLLANLGTCGRCQLDLGQICLDAEYTATGRCRADVDKKQLALDELRDLCLFFVLGFDAEQTTEKEETNFKF
jgi:hypothetical protein